MLRDGRSPLATVSRGIKKENAVWRGRPMWARQEEVSNHNSADKKSVQHLSGSPLELTDSVVCMASAQQALPPVPVNAPLPPLPELTYDEKLEVRLQKSLGYVRGLRKEDVAAWRQHACAWRSRTEAVRLRSEPLGSDRYHRRYWVLADDFSRIWVEKSDHSKRDHVVWGSYDTIKQVDALVKALNPHGLRENALREALAIYRLVCSPSSPSSPSCPASHHSCMHACYKPADRPKSRQVDSCMHACHKPAHRPRSR